MELAIEAKARDEGMQAGMEIGLDEGTVRSTLKMMRRFNLPPAAFFSALNSNFDGDSERARQALARFMQENPEEEPYIKAAEAEARAETQAEEGRTWHEGPTR